MIFNNDTWAHSADEDPDGIVNDITEWFVTESKDFQTLVMMTFQGQ